ncbi:MAG: CpaD family pilus assembly lipoprotein [Sphingomonadales bacterium]
MMVLLHATMKRSVRLAIGLIGVAGAVSLSACGINNTYMPPRAGYVEPAPRVAASLTSLTYRIELGQGQVALTRAQIDGLNRFLASNGEADGDHIEIRTSTMAGPARNAAIAGSLRESFLAGGYSPLRVEVIETPRYADMVEVAIQRYTVLLPDCGREIGRNEGISEWSDEPVGVRKLGCTNEYNLGLMIADPRDLHGGRTLGPAKGYREVGAVQRYRTDKIKELESISSKEGE